MRDAAFVLLAAGESTRMGRPKGLLDYRGATWLETQVGVIHGQGIPRIILVLGADMPAYDAVLARLPGVESRINPSPDRGPFSSLLMGLKDAKGSAWISPLDVPVMENLSTLEAALNLDVEAVVPTFEGRGGHPVLLSRAFIQRLQAVNPAAADARLDHQLRLAATRRVQVMDPKVILNLNTPEAWNTFLAQP